MSYIKKFHKSIFYIGITIYVILTFIHYQKAFSLLTLVSILTFVTYMCVLLWSIGKPNKFYNSRRLSLTVFTYQTIFVSIFLFLSYVYDGDFFLFSKIDSKIYEYDSFKLAALPYDRWMAYISDLYLFDDWGAFYMMGTVLKIIPSKFFLNFCDVVYCTVMSVLLFGIGKRIMPRSYAYIASLAYSTASYTVYFNGTFLKEPFFLLLFSSSLYFFYRYLERKKLFDIALCILFSLSIVFFRPAVMLFLWVSYFGYFLATNSSKIPLFVKILVVLIISILVYSQVTQIFNRYTNEGDVTQVAESRANEDKGVSGGSFMYAVVGVGTLIGPFPTIIQSNTGTPRGPLYGVGLLYKMFLAVPFWLGSYYAFKRKAYIVYPLIILVLVESLPLILIQQGLEIRKGLLHVCAFYMTAFWFFYQASVRKREGKALNFLMKYNYVFVFIIVIGWNLLRK